MQRFTSRMFGSSEKIRREIGPVVCISPLRIAAKENPLPKVPMTLRPTVAAPIAVDSGSDIGWQQLWSDSMHISDVSSMEVFLSNGHGISIASVVSR